MIAVAVILKSAVVNAVPVIQKSAVVIAVAVMRSTLRCSIENWYAQRIAGRINTISPYMQLRKSEQRYKN